ncbi:hypothetical protein Hanom_Chr07g00631841 [Helianthus anomalus]
MKQQNLEFQASKEGAKQHKLSSQAKAKVLRRPLRMSLRNKPLDNHHQHLSIKYQTITKTNNQQICLRHPRKV